jgi:hypothetical protein
VDRALVLRDGSAGFLLCHYALWFHERLERLDVGPLDDWGWASRTIRGSSVVSNHASGTAIDLNARKHPMGAPTRATFSRREVAEIHKRLRLYRGCLRWGGDYVRRADAMHVEIDADMARVEARARVLCSTKRGVRILESNPGAHDVILS